MTLFYIIASTFLISLLSLVGLLMFFTGKKFVQKIVVFLISLSAGTLMGGVFFHLLPEASQLLSTQALFSTVLYAFIGFYLIERLLHWRHCHHHHVCKVHTFGYMNLIGDGVHNFLDGMVIAAAFLVEIRLGVVTSFAIMMHEIPQEIGDFGVLIKAGFTKRKALAFNFFTALLAMGGALISYFLAGQIEGLTTYLLPVAAGGFLYIAAADLLPEIRKEEKLSKALAAFIFFMIGIILTYSLKSISS